MEEGMKEINLDSILESLGPYGRYNLLNFVLLLYPVLLSSFFECGFIFEAQEQYYRCEVHGCEQRFNDTSWLNYTIPLNPATFKPDRCLRYAPVTNDTNLQCQKEEFTNLTVPCESYVYEEGHSFVKEFNLGCQEWKRALVGTIHNSGMFMSMLFTGAISDRFGRRVAVGFASLGSLIFGLSRAFTPTYIMYVIMHFLEASTGGGLYASAYVFIIELVGKKQRVIVSAMCNMVFVIGVVLIALLAWVVDNWRTYVIILYCPAIPVIIYMWFTNESARWLLSKGKKDEAVKVLKRAAKINRLDPRKLELDSLANPLLKPQNQTDDKKSQLSKAIRSVIIWKRLLICSFMWLTCSLVYYGLSINSVSLSSNRYLSFMLVVLVEIPAYVVVVIVLDKYGRKKTLITTFIICAVTSLLFAFLPRSDLWSLPLYLIGKWSVTLAYSSVYIYVSEVFPTNMRQTLISVCSTAGRIGSLLAPVTPLLSQYHKSMPTVIFGIMATLSCLLVFLLPETRNMRLPDTIEEAEQLCGKNKVKRTEDVS
ncbi:organic cation transporter protein isoform X1 [Amyelois transitella]|uniref:organic cation transporter protein isoform X1 n=1 Tax=Amyelois transitella TaxID=680683 RepID=UPI0029903CF1|nr:organic cation transporter protein isoform X1 [Amyelois transitella]XP_060804426.1 organic cation transporter protein isoform X1 [Amyelois transitella]